MTSSLPQILLVDDIEVNLILLETALRKEKAKLFKATSGPEALELTLVNEFALIILDVSMPVMSGFELAALIREQPLNYFTPIIFISANMFDEFSVSQGYRSGAVDYISKPYHHEILVSKVRVFLQLYCQKKDLQEQSIILQESNKKYQDIQETLRLKLQLEKAVSLASARFSGNFDIDNSIYFMLCDLSSVCNSGIVSYIPCDSAATIAYNDGKDISLEAEFIEKNKNRIISEFSKQGTDIITSLNSLPYKWEVPGKIESQVTLAIKVASGEKVFGIILASDCKGLIGWEHSEINSLSVFGTVTGNALERDYTRKALIESEQRYKNYIKHAPEGIAITDAYGVILEYNEAFGSIFGSCLKKDSIFNISNLLNKTNHTSANSKFSTLINGKLSKGEFVITVNNKGKIVKAESVKLPSKQYLIFCTDITRELEIEKHLIQTERMVGIGEMATGIAHEINQPLNTISFSLDNLIHAIKENKADGSYISEKSKKIFDSIHRMRNIIDHVRNFARGNDDVMRSNFSISEPVLNAISFYSGELKNAGILVHNESNGSLVDACLYGNTYKVEQVILNLLSNAKDSLLERKLKEKEGYVPEIHVKVEHSGNKARIIVSDNGLGIRNDQLSQVKQPFFTTKAPGKGTGLGLAISQSIITQHGGNLILTSEYGKGTSVKIELPLVKENSQVESV
jgi:PAS domain S-box-containing protein